MRRKTKNIINSDNSHTEFHRFRRSFVARWWLGTRWARCVCRSPPSPKETANSHLWTSTVTRLASAPSWPHHPSGRIKPWCDSYCSENFPEFFPTSSPLILIFLNLPSARIRRACVVWWRWGQIISWIFYYFLMYSKHFPHNFTGS